MAQLRLAVLDSGERTAYVVLSSSSASLLRKVTTCMRAAGLHVIGSATLHDFRPVSDSGVVVAGLWPSYRVMPQVQQAVAMRGQGSVQTAMNSGTPLVGLPLHPSRI